MANNPVPDEKEIVEKILRRRASSEVLISAEAMKVFKAAIGEEIQRSGALSEEFVERLMQKAKSGDL